MKELFPFFDKRFFDKQLQNLPQMSPVKFKSKGMNTKNESDILIGPFNIQFAY